LQIISQEIIMFEALTNLYKQMDKTWNEIANFYDFQCNGCDDNCCCSLFFHHTHIEKAYLLYGFNQLESYKRTDARIRAEEYIKETFAAGKNVKSLKIMCPLNEEEKCVLYPYRPMICRLHGLPHEVRLHVAKPIFGKGCKAGYFDNKAYTAFDRTPFYKQMAQLEASWRSKTGQTDKIKETVAHMIL
jgi:Fe-S-cluster containining protein